MSVDCPLEGILPMNSDFCAVDLELWRIRHENSRHQKTIPHLMFKDVLVEGTVYC